MADSTPAAPLTCGCGGQLFDVGQLSWNTQRFDAAADDWGGSEYAYEGEYEISVRCLDCEADCTALAIAAGWRIHHEYPLLRRARTSVDIPIPGLLKINGRNGTARNGRITLTADGQLEIWKGWSNERFPMASIDLRHEQTAITVLAELLEAALDRREASKEACRAEATG